MSRRNDDKQPPRQPRGHDRRRPTQAQALKRQQEIALDRDVGNMTWAAIGRKHSMGEKEARQLYQRYVLEIVPLIVGRAPQETVLEYLQVLAGVRQRLAEVVDTADNDSARIGGLREIVKTVAKEIDLLQHAGLMPTDIGEARARAEHEQLLQRVEDVLRRHSAPPELYDELAATLDPDSTP